ncbi:MAG TPA: penicillin-binding transpeptidase domain-containing protein, partial [Vicinamibacteria bacterium]|nr:penicillin-binding transpeptidase domain-containing protein [Vicinamibacteria bacterium]
ASRLYFGTSARKLTLSQSALLAALIRGPGYYDPRRHAERARERRDLVLALMESQHRITALAASRARATPLGVVPRRPTPGSEPGLGAYFVEEIRRQAEDRFGERVYSETLELETTLDSGLQRAAEEELERQLRAVSPELQGAVVVLQVGTGDVLAWVGGRDFRDSRFDRVRSARRQVGSAFKPFVYAAALQQGHPLSERLQDEPLQVRLRDGRVWQPKNFDGEYQGAVTVREALVRSRNVPTVRLAEEVGASRIARTAHQAGIRSTIDEGPAMPLGTAATSPLELATAYSAFATLGERVEPRLLARARGEDGRELWSAPPSPRRRVLDPAVAFLVTDVLEEAVERGTGTAVRSAGFDGRAAGKTGTTNDATDAWFVGYTPSMTAAVWIGFDDPRPITALASGGRLAAPVWGRLMARARPDPDAPTAWRMPDTIEEAWVDPDSGTPLSAGCRPRSGRATRELFLRDAIPRRTCPAHGEPDPLEAAPSPSDHEASPDLTPPLRQHQEKASLLRVAANRAWHAVRREAVKRFLEWQERQEKRREEEREERRRQEHPAQGG